MIFSQAFWKSNQVEEMRQESSMICLFGSLPIQLLKSIRNQISILLGEGGTLGFLTPIRDIKDVINHVNAQS